MGAALTCCRPPAAAQDEEGVRKDGLAPPGGQAARLAAAAAAAASPGDSGAASPRSLHAQPSSVVSGFYSAADGYASEGDDDVWHDALSELDVDLAEELERWEEQTLQGRDTSVDAAIEVLRGHGHLLPPALEAAAREQRSADREAALHAAALEGGARVHVAAAALAAAKKPHLARSRSQELRIALDAPAARSALASAAALAAQGRALAAHAAVLQAAAAAGGSLAELAELPPDALQSVLPAGASLDVAGLMRDVRFVGEALQSLEDHLGWMVSRNDALKVFYRHQRGTTVHSLKFSAVLDHPLEHLLALVHEFDLIVTWNKFSLASLMLAEPSIFESYVYGAQWMMRPFKPMQGLLHARGFDLADEHKCLLVSLEDCTPEQLPPGHRPLPPEYHKRKTVNFLPGSCLRLRPLPAAPDGTPRTEGSLLLHLDPHIPFIPAFLLNFVLGVLAPYVYKQVVHVLDNSFADPASIYNQRIREQPHLYGLVQQRLAEFEGELSPRASQALEAEAEAKGSGKQRRRKGRTATPA
ncbi:hypothetical protein ABPG75_009473 [Micractinium tetrahymenae]